MRVIAGLYRGHKLNALEGIKTRPTLDRVKEALFSILQNDLAEVTVLDLFAGSGGLGIEALSRGAGYIIFNDYNRQAISIIQENIEALKIPEGYEINCLAYPKLLAKLASSKKVIDIVLLDPPYLQNITSEIVETLIKNNNLAPKCVIAIETAKTTPTETIVGFNKKEYIYGSVKLSIYRRIIFSQDQ